MRKTILIGILAITLSACSGNNEDKSSNTTQSAPDKLKSATDNTAGEAGTLADDKLQPAGATAQQTEANLREEPGTMGVDAPDAVARENDAAQAAPDLTLGNDVYSSKCFTCHSSGVAGAPKLADQTDWRPRIAQGMDTLLEHATTGFKGSAGYMPPKGGYSTLSDAELSAAVAYMVSKSQ